MMIIAKHFEFEAAHKLPDRLIYGQCADLHGHTYKLTIEIKGEVLPNGMVMNFKDLKAIVKKEVIDKYDHAYLNEFFYIPTAEIMVQQIGMDVKANLPSGVNLHSVTLYETSNSYAKITY